MLKPEIGSTLWIKHHPNSPAHECAAVVVPNSLAHSIDSRSFVVKGLDDGVLYLANFSQISSAPVISAPPPKAESKPDFVSSKKKKSAK